MGWRHPTGGENARPPFSPFFPSPDLSSATMSSSELYLPACPWPECQLAESKNGSGDTSDRAQARHKQETSSAPCRFKKPASAAARVELVSCPELSVHTAEGIKEDMKTRKMLGEDAEVKGNQVAPDSRDTVPTIEHNQASVILKLVVVELLVVALGACFKVRCVFGALAHVRSGSAALCYFKRQLPSQHPLSPPATAACCLPPTGHWQLLSARGQQAAHPHQLGWRRPHRQPARLPDQRIPIPTGPLGEPSAVLLHQGVFERTGLLSRLALQGSWNFLSTPPVLVCQPLVQHRPDVCAPTMSTSSQAFCCGLLQLCVWCVCSSAAAAPCTAMPSTRATMAPTRWSASPFFATGLC